MTTRTRTWLHGLAAYVIGGVSSSIVTYMGMVLAKHTGIDVPDLNLKALGVIFLSAGIFNAAAYLKQSPLPPDGPDTVILTKGDLDSSTITTTPKP